MSSMNTAMPYSESVSMNRNTPKAKSSPKRRYKPKPSVNKNQPPLEKPNFNSRTGKLVEVLYGRRHCSNSSGDLALLCTYFVANKRHNNKLPKGTKPFVGNVTSNDDFYSDKRKSYTTIENEKSHKLHNNKLPKGTKPFVGNVTSNDDFYSDKRKSYTTIENEKSRKLRNNKLPKGTKQFVGNITSNNDFYSDKRKFYTTIENEKSHKLQQYDKPSEKINAVLKDLGFVSNTDKMYTFYPAQIHYHKDAQKHIDRYGQKSYIAPKPKNSIDSSNGYNQKGRQQKSIPSKTYPENNRYNRNDKIENSIGSSDGYNQKGRQQKSIPSKTYPENNRYNRNDKIENSIDSSNGYNQKGRQQKSIPSKTYPENNRYNRNDKIENSIGSSDGYNQKGRQQKSIPSKTYPENNRYNRNDKIENSIGSSDGYNQKRRQQKSIPSKTYLENNRYNRNDKIDNSIGSSDGYNQKGRQQKSIPSKTYLENNRYNRNDKIENSIGSSDGYNQKGRQQKSIPSKTYLENNRYNRNDKIENSIGSSNGYNQKERQQKSIPSKTYPENNQYNRNDKIKNHHQHSKIQKNTGSNKLTWQKNTNNFHQDKQLPIKYWSMRHLLFSNFDRGILLDTESFYSVCPEVLSYHIAKRCRNNTVLDPFCGAGGNIIQLAKTCKRVIAIDIDPNKIKLARHNAEIYGVAHKIEFIVGDFFLIYPKLKADVVFMSPPWGGPGYSIDKSFSLKSMCANYFGGGFKIFDIVKTIAPNIAFHMPKTTNILECMWLAKDFGQVEIQQNIINGRLNSLTAFYGNFH